MKTVEYDAKNRLYLFLLIVSQILIGIIIAVSAFLWVKSISEHTEEMLKEEAISIVEDELRNHVGHMITHIERENRVITDDMQNMMDIVFQLIDSQDIHQVEPHLGKWMQVVSKIRNGQLLSVVLHDSHTNRMIRFSKNQIDDITGQFNAHTLLEHVQSRPIHKIHTLGNKKVYIFIELEAIKHLVKEEIYDDIHNFLYGNEGYVWINEVINFDGGDRYAVRIIYPGMADMEGEYLSTEMEDIAGNLPYQKELEGIREKGEIFQTYYFKNKADNKVFEKASFAKFYKPFRWVVASGKPVEDVMLYANELSDYSDNVLDKALWSALLCVCAMVVFGIGVIVVVNKIHQRETATYIDQETRLDPLTGVLSRKAAEGLLTEGIEKAKHNKATSMLMILDIDNFKKINDTYGHDVGDLVLKKVSEKILNSLRKTDHLIRWGGEEFVIFFNNLPLNRHYFVGKNLLESVNAISFECKRETFNVTISVGSSYVYDTDKSYSDALKRADIALYHSKNTGKNKYTYTEDMA